MDICAHGDDIVVCQQYANLPGRYQLNGGRIGNNANTDLRMPRCVIGQRVSVAYMDYNNARRGDVRGSHAYATIVAEG